MPSGRKESVTREVNILIVDDHDSPKITSHAASQKTPPVPRTGRWGTRSQCSHDPRTLSKRGPRGTVHPPRGPMLAHEHIDQVPCWDRPRAPGADATSAGNIYNQQGPSSRAGGRRGHPRGLNPSTGTVLARRGPTGGSRLDAGSRWDRPRAPGADGVPDLENPAAAGPSSRAGGRQSPRQGN